MYCSLYPRSIVDHLYLPRSLSGKVNLKDKQAVEEQRQALNDCTQKSKDKFLD